MAAKTGKCAHAAKHRTAQKRYVAKDKAAQRRRVRAHYRKNATQIKADKRKARKAKDKAKGGGGRAKVGRPRECS